MLIIPAILTKSKKSATEQLDILRAHVPWVQIDLMDGTMTPEKTIPLEDLRDGALDEFLVEVHLMTTTPEMYFDACEALGVQRVYFHLDAVENPSAVLRAMDPYSFSKGIALSPQTPVEDVLTFADEIDAVQVMTVVPGEQGGQFIESCLEKVPFLRERRTELWLSVDGGVNMKTIVEVSKKQLDGAGVGSAISLSEDPLGAIVELVVAVEKAQEV